MTTLTKSINNPVLVPTNRLERSLKMRKTSDDTTSSLRSVANKKFLIPKPKINLFKNSLSHSGAIILNSIPLEIKNATSINNFVSKCTASMKN